MPTITPLDFLLWILRRRRRVAIVNRSMLPLLQPGDEVLVNPRAYRHHAPQVGDVVIVADPREPKRLIIKRVYRVLANNEFEVRGDNPDESTDSRVFGSIRPHQLRGKVTCRFSPAVGMSSGS